MPEPHRLVSLEAPLNTKCFSPGKCSASVALFVLAIALLMAGTAACGGQLGPEPGASENPPTAALPTAVAPTPIIPTATVTVATAESVPLKESIETPVPPQPSGLIPADSFPVPPDRDFFRLAKELLPGVGDISPVVRHDSVPLEVGHRETLQLVDLEAPELYESDFELRLVTPNAYWLVEDGLKVEQDDLERSAAEFEETIYPLVTGAFGSEWKPGIDGDPRLYIINASLQGVGGYYSASDEYPKALRPVSNERESIYINSRYLPVGTDIYAQVLAHELQHAIHWNADRTEETWVNEGLSELAVTIAGYRDASIRAFRRAGPTSLTNWPAGEVGGSENYGAASLFMHYFTERYGGREDLRPLLAEDADGIPGINAYLEAAGHDVTFADVFRDWAVANLLDEDGSRFGYSEFSFTFPVYANIRVDGGMQTTVPQYANEYVRLEAHPTATRLVFEGVPTAPLLPIESREGCWWSNKGDVIDSTLSTAIDLRGVDSAALSYDVWYSIEEDWDFAYVEVSADGGETWTILETPLTSVEDPLNVSFGPGYTGASDGWQRESVSLDRWAGQRIMLRFQYITDAAIHDHGLCLRNLNLTGSDGERMDELAWTANGFFWTHNIVRQDFIVQVVYEGKEAEHNRVLQVELDSENKGEIIIEPDPSAKRVVAVIQPLAPSTRIPAVYALRLEAVE